MNEFDKQELRDKLMGLGKSSMRKNYYVDLKQELEQRIEAEKALKALNDDLEKEVHQRTQELVQMQKHLMQSEKLASLGGLVAGISHEVNTPLGIGVTVSSYLLDILKDLRLRIDHEKFAHDELISLVDEGIEASIILENNLKRSVDLMENFKLIAVDQSQHSAKLFNYYPYTLATLKSLNTEIKKKSVHVNVEALTFVEHVGFPGLWSQVVVNLVINSVMHAFEDTNASLKGQNCINIELNMINRELVCRYSDNGKGMSEDELSHLFEPFYTTKRGMGGTGLGMFIVHNIVVNQLGGSIVCGKDMPSGIVFTIRIPEANRY